MGCLFELIFLPFRMVYWFFKAIWEFGELLSHLSGHRGGHRKRRSTTKRVTYSVPQQKKPSDADRVRPFGLSSIPDDRPSLPKKRLFGNNKEYYEMLQALRKSDEAFKAFNAREYERAITLLQESEMDFPNSVYLKFARAIALLRCSRYKEAHALFETLPQVDDDYIQLQRADAAIGAKETTRALELLHKLSRSKQLESSVLLKKSGLLIELQQYTTALEVLKDFNPRLKENKGYNNSLYHYFKGLCFEHLGQTKNAIKEYEKSLAFKIEGADVEERLNALKGSAPGNNGMVESAPALDVSSGQDAKRKGIVGAQWVASNDSCPLCHFLDGKVVSVDHPDFDRFVPPLHDGCKCVRVYVGAGQAHVEFDWQTPPEDLIRQHAPHLL